MTGRLAVVLAAVAVAAQMTRQHARRTIPFTRSASSCPIHPAVRPTPWRGSPPRGSPPNSAATSLSKIFLAPAAGSRPRTSPAPRLTATRCFWAVPTNMPSRRRSTSSTTTLSKNCASGVAGVQLDRNRGQPVATGAFAQGTRGLCQRTPWQTDIRRNGRDRDPSRAHVFPRAYGCRRAVRSLQGGGAGAHRCHRQPDTGDRQRQIGAVAAHQSRQVAGTRGIEHRPLAASFRRSKPSARLGSAAFPAKCCSVLWRPRVRPLT